jgi:DNA-directed RNA polymerase subunit E'/Rpb7
MSSKIDKSKSKKKLFSPYTNAIFEVPIMLNPNQLDNNLELHLKQNLIDKHVGKCLSNYGYICKIYKILEISNGYIDPEDFSCSAKQTVKFACKICRPLKNQDVILKMTKTRSEINGGVNGPLFGLITPDKINKENFYIDVEKNIRHSKTLDILSPNMFVKCEILNFEYSDNESIILMIVLLKDIASPDEITDYEKQLQFDIEPEADNNLSYID